MKATNSFHNTSVDIELLERANSIDKYSNEPIELVRIVADTSKLCGMNECKCHVMDQKEYYIDEHYQAWYLAKSFE